MSKKLPVTTEWLKSERRVRNILDTDEKRGTLGTACCYQLTDIGKRNMKYVMKVVEEVMAKYHPADSKWEIFPEKEEAYLTLPGVAQVECNMILASVGFKLYHIKDVGRIC